MPTDILHTDISFKGQDVYIIGSGPTAKEGALRMPAIATTIVVNRAVLLEHIKPDYWLCATPALAREQWFQDVMDNSPSVPVIARYGDLLEKYPDIPYYFHPGASLWSEPHMPFGCIEGYLRGGASAPARAMQLAWFKEAARCILVGADMRGDGYFDGTRNEHKHRTMDKDGYWLELPYFQRLIEWVKGRVMEVFSLTPTAVDVEVIKNV